MAKAKTQSLASTVTRSDQMTANKPSKSLTRLPAAELLSFLKETRGSVTWTEDDLAKALNIGLAEAKEAVVVLQLQGYIEPAGRTGKWRTRNRANSFQAPNRPASPGKASKLRSPL